MAYFTTKGLGWRADSETWQENSQEVYCLAGFLPHSHASPAKEATIYLIQLYINLELIDILKKAEQQTMDLYKKLVSLTKQSHQTMNLKFNYWTTVVLE